MFPQARFLHLLRHPRAQCESFWKAMEQKAEAGKVPGWFLRSASGRGVSLGKGKALPKDAGLDPKRAWFKHTRHICEFLATVPEDQKMRIRGEDLLSDPDPVLQRIAAWLGIRTDADAIAAMKHPEDSRYASIGPRGATFGNNRSFLENPALRPYRNPQETLNGPLSWRVDRQGFSPRVKQHAREFGYQ